ncbi:MAG: hypothetical protein L0Z53_09505 [Acidobacteriales bacterium]|nr:hypothetical protein [Terriglobales bacterium]
MRLKICCVALLAPILSAILCVSAETTVAPSLDRGYRNMYNLQFGPAQAEFDAWQRHHPHDPLGPISEAAGLLFAELNRLGVLETRLFEDNSRFEKRKKLKPDAAVRTQFQAAVSRGEVIAREVLAKSPNDQDALFALTLAYGLRADYTALVEKRNLAALKHTKEASALAKRLLTVEPNYYDAYLATGISKYIVGSLVAPVRWFARLAGYEGNKEEGIKELQVAAKRGRFLAPFARILLCVAYLRDDDRQKARILLAGLRNDFPQNDLFARELARLDGKVGEQ